MVDDEKILIGWSIYFSGVCRKTMLLLIGFPWKKILSAQSSDREFLHSLSDDEDDDDDDSCFRVISNFLHFDPNVKTFFFCSSKDSFLGWRHKRGSKSNIPPMVSRKKNDKDINLNNKHISVYKSMLNMSYQNKYVTI